MKALAEIQGRTDKLLDSMADRLTSFRLRNQNWILENNDDGLLLGEGSWGTERGFRGSRRSSGVQEHRESYSVAGSEGSITPSVGSMPPQASGSSSPCSPSSPRGSRRSVSALKKWLTNPVRKLSPGTGLERGGEGGKGKKQDSMLDEKQASAQHPPSQAPGRPLEQGENYTILPCSQRDLESSGLVNPAESAPVHPLYHSYLSDLLPETHTDSLNQASTNILPDDGDHASFTDDSTSQWSASMDTEEDRRSALEKSIYVLTELIETEKLYVEDLGLIVEGYITTMSNQGVPEDMKGKDKIVFGNIHQIYDWHKDYLLGELEKCVNEPDRLAQLFIKHERRLHMYVVYCQNKPKSEHIVSEYIETYFEELRQQLNHRLQLNDLLIKPVQRIMKYQLLLKDFLKYYTKAGRDTAELEKAVEVMCFVPKRCNDMMNVGRLQGFEGKITAQGKLLQQDTFSVSEQDSSFLSKPKERRVFLFEQLVIFSEPIDRKKGFSLPGYTFKNSIKVSCLGVEDVSEEDPCGLVLTSRGTDGSVTRFIMQASSPETQQAWVNDVVQILDTQRNFLNALQSPIEYQRRENKGKSNSLGRAMRVPMALTSGLRPHSSASIDRHRLPCLHSYNTSLPSLHLPSQGHVSEAGKQPPLLPNTMVSNPSPLTSRPSLLPLNPPPQLILSSVGRHGQGVSNGLSPPGQPRSQVQTPQQRNTTPTYPGRTTRV
ncbi:rho guanine nucleotide exchange factor 25 isoform X2 [Hypomesus transpacificus]|uniref:rho guanine nucleotide exchange factor 25 isoform X2 n=1 Tax=Hypomesus transpacificus TaxID=137520 RepID=UPI001F08538B|nr:rho guanine nucleotide exchange factor 25 isoform X2 [Hypomesus transpacificus]